MKLHSTITSFPKPLVGLVALFIKAFLLVPPLAAEEGPSQTHTSALYFINAEGAELYDLSADGSTVVGSFRNAAGFREGFVWSVEGGFLPLGTLGGTTPKAHAVSADGSVVVGYA